MDTVAPVFVALFFLGFAEGAFVERGCGRIGELTAVFLYHTGETFDTFGGISIVVITEENPVEVA